MKIHWPKVKIPAGNEDIDKIWGCKGIAKDFASVKPSYMEDL
jgi:hypothetical protein